MKNLAKKSLKAAVFIIAAVFLSSLKSESGNDKNYNTNLQIINAKNGRASNFKVKIVSNSKDRERGLMFVKSMAESHGMLFEFEQEQIIQMWMKNTKIPLDMIFIDANGVVVNIKKRAQPESLAIISSEKKVQKVLEINGGIAEKLAINVGDKIVVVSN